MCRSYDSVWSPLASMRALVLYTGSGGPGQLEWLSRSGSPECVFRPATAEILSLADVVLLGMPPQSDSRMIECKFPAELIGSGKPAGQLWLIARFELGAGKLSASAPTREARRRKVGSCGGPELWGTVDGRLSIPRVENGRTQSKVRLRHNLLKTETVVAPEINSRSLVLAYFVNSKVLNLANS